MAKIFDEKYKELTGKEEFSEEEYAKLRKEHPEVELEFKEQKEIEDKIREVQQLQRRKQEIQARLATLTILLSSSAVGITEIERMMALQSEEGALQLELTKINEILEEQNGYPTR